MRKSDFSTGRKKGEGTLAACWHLFLGFELVDVFVLSSHLWIRTSRTKDAQRRQNQLLHVNPVQNPDCEELFHEPLGVEDVSWVQGPLWDSQNHWVGGKWSKPRGDFQGRCSSAERCLAAEHAGCACFLWLGGSEGNRYIRYSIVLFAC